PNRFRSGGRRSRSAVTGTPRDFPGIPARPHGGYDSGRRGPGAGSGTAMGASARRQTQARSDAGGRRGVLSGVAAYKQLLAAKRARPMVTLNFDRLIRLP